MLEWQGKTEGEESWNREFIALCQVEMAWGTVILEILVLTTYS